MDVSYLIKKFSVLLNVYYLIKSPDTFIYTTADHNGFLMPQSGANFVVRFSGKFIDKLTDSIFINENKAL